MDQMILDKIDAALCQAAPELKELALKLHANPELGNEEFKACRWQVELVQYGGNHRTICDPAKITICGMPEAGEAEKTQDNPGEGEKKPRKKAEKFVPPTEEEVLAYCRERGNSVDPVSFVSFYSAKNWMIGKNKMKDWRAAVRTWEQREIAVQSQRDEEKKPSSFDTDEFFEAALRRTYSDSEVEAYMNESGRKARA